MAYEAHASSFKGDGFVSLMHYPPFEIITYKDDGTQSENKIGITFSDGKDREEFAKHVNGEMEKKKQGPQ